MRTVHVGLWKFEVQALSPLQGSDIYSDDCEPLIDFMHPGYAEAYFRNLPC